MMKVSFVRSLDRFTTFHSKLQFQKDMGGGGGGGKEVLPPLMVIIYSQFKVFIYSQL